MRLRSWSLPCLLVAALPLWTACGDDDPAKPAKADAASDAVAEVEAGSDAEPGSDAQEGSDTTEAAYPSWPILPAGMPLLALADPFIGTGFSGANIGAAFPGAQLPFSTAKVSPDTINDGGALGAFHTAGYQYIDPYIYGISHNHLQGTGVPDYGNLAVMPYRDGSFRASVPKKHKSRFQHANERAWPGYYGVEYDDVLARHEVTATKHCGHHRVTFAKGSAGTKGLLVDIGSVISDGRVAGAEVQIDATGKVATGQLRHIGPFSGRYGGFDVYFQVRWDRTPGAWGTWNGDAIEAGQAATATTADPTNLGLWLEFADSEPGAELQVCLSYVDVAGAKANAAAELPAFAFDQTVQAAGQIWQTELAKVEVEGGSASDQKIFYSALYRVMNMPTSWTDVDGRYRGFKGVIRKAEGYDYVTDLSLWDTFRTLNPLLVFLLPDRGRDVVRSMQAMIEDGGWAPKWAMGMGDTGSMIGQHAVSVFADSYVRGITDFDLPKVYQNLRHNALGPYQGDEYGRRDQLQSYLTRGWIAKDETSGSVSKTLEYAFNDYCLAQLATAMNLPDDATLFAAGAKNYQHLWDKDTEFFRARMTSGEWAANFNPLPWDFDNAEYVEGTAWQWGWFVPHDPAGLRALYPSNEAFLAKLTAFFENAKNEFSFVFPTAWYFHGNEPDILAMTLFSGAGQPELADKWARWVGDVNYTTAPDGLVGNDDAGTLSAWYVFAAGGLLPRPCDPGFDVVAPRFDKVTWHLPGGKLVVSAPGVSSGAIMQGSVSWNGTPLAERWLPHADAAKGGQLTFAPKP